MRYDKLVRDGIPGHIRSLGKTPVTHRADPESFAVALGEKLCEEAAEVNAATTHTERVMELADLAEVLNAFREVHGITEEEIEAARVRKLDERGGFAQRIILEEVPED